MNAETTMTEAGPGRRRAPRGLAMLMGFALISSGMVAGAASPALAEEPALAGAVCGEGSWWDFPEPMVEGRAQVGKTLSASHASVVPAADSIKYQWYSTDVNSNADMVAISGANGLTYTPYSPGRGSTISRPRPRNGLTGLTSAVSMASSTNAPPPRSNGVTGLSACPRFH